MNDYLRRNYEACAAASQLLTDNLTDFNTGMPNTKRLALAAAVADIETKNAELAGGFGETSMEFEQKGTAREILRSDVAMIADMAEGMEPDFDGITDLFRFRRNLPDADLLALARAFHTSSATYEADFIAYGLSATFRADLNTQADAFETETGDASTAKADRVGAGQALAASVAAAMQLKRTMDPIVRTKYTGNPGKLAAWTSASTVEKAPKKPPTP